MDCLDGHGSNMPGYRQTENHSMTAAKKIQFATLVSLVGASPFARAEFVDGRELFAQPKGRDKIKNCVLSEERKAAYAAGDLVLFH